MMTSEEIRSKFLEFFKSKNHKIVSSAPIVNKTDPGLMFINAGMNQFKDIFLGNKPIQHSRVANSQKCLRVSGKHNDLEEVGLDTYHHTMFEMLGNWSFGDYFKEEAIDLAWELLTEVYKIDKDRLYVTVFGGDKVDNLEVDEEAKNLWKKYVPESRIILGNKKDNFWEMGDQGPCGPCSEIHIDLRDDDDRKKIDGAKLVNKDDPSVIEIWNLVFIQYNRKANGELVPLDKKHIDTGMGLERLCMILQNVKSNYDTDIFQSIIKKISAISGFTYGKDEQTNIAMRVIADHLRAIVFAISDGQLPSNTGAGYVIRRILRRTVRYGYTFLNLKEPFIYSLVDTLVEKMGKAYPEIEKQSYLCKNIILEEENSFLKTLSTGIQRFNSYIKEYQDKKIIEGEFVFELFDTFGFPVDLTKLMASELGKSIDEEGFDKKLEEQKQRSRKAAEQSVSDWIEVDTDTSCGCNGETEFCGYDHLDDKIKILRYREVQLKNKTLYQLVFSRTPFYAESGGQVGDIGYIESETEKINIINTIKENDLIVHISEKLPENINAQFVAHVGIERRKAITANHTATHLLHYALRETLGDHVEQKGSFVGPEYLRFDFSHYQKVTDEELLKVEKLVNKLIREDVAREEERNVPIEEAVSKGAMALFGEKYGDVVRTIRFGNSIELCGGTHVDATGNIGVFKILSESVIAAGVRRIEAVTGENALSYISEQCRQIQEIKQMLKAKDSVKGVCQLVDQNKALKKEIEDLNKEKANIIKKNLVNRVENINGVDIIHDIVDIDPKQLKDLSFELKQGKSNLAVILGNTHENKASICIVLTDDLVEKGKHAGKVIKEAVKEINGGGGGQAVFATAGGKDIDKIGNAVEKAKDLLAE
ncbi:MAG: alanine--tRNA ligase [Bacteroidales bacterium]|jgi:alanyl-tRNA synthetase